MLFSSLEPSPAFTSCFSSVTLRLRAHTMLVYLSSVGRGVLLLFPLPQARKVVDANGLADIITVHHCRVEVGDVDCCQP